VAGQGSTVFVVRKQQGILAEPVSNVGLQDTAVGEVEFDNAVGEPLGAVGSGELVHQTVTQAGRKLLRAAARAVARKELADARAYAERRTAFGRPIAEFAAIRELFSGGWKTPTPRPTLRHCSSTF
jgi:alkylation response protein AidB-like acyl-CoA dehydrogenase